MIYGLTDKFIPRRDGKIRAGTRDEATKKMDNTPYFLLHDAPQLIPVLGENPKEIYFTVWTDNKDEFFRPDLRWYTRNELVCVGDGRTAAYRAFEDVPGVKQTAHPRDPKARERSCLYKSCPQYLEGKCGEHFFLDIIVPQYSMGSVFTLDNTSLYAILNIHSAIQKALLASGGKLSGQIFKLSKKIVPIGFTDVAKAKKYNRDQAVIHVDYVPLEFLPKSIQEKITPDNQSALMGLRNGLIKITDSLPSLDQAQAVSSEAPTALPSPDEGAKEELLLQSRANDPTVVKLLDELSKLTGVPNSEDNRLKLARNVTPPTVEGVVTYIKARINKVKKAIPTELTKEEAEVVKANLGIPPVETKPANGAAAANGTLF
jgi:hypothetical protein